MKFKSQLVTQVSGSVGGLTGSRNRGGNYFRARAIPTNPNTALQQAVRSNFSFLTTAWSSVLTQPQRDAWSNYAENTPVTDTLGDPLTLTGQQMYIRCNSVRLNVGLTQVPEGPTTMGLGNLSEFSLSVSDGDGDIDVSFDPTDAWAIIDDGALQVQFGRQISQTINFFNGPYRSTDPVLGDTAVPPTSPQLLDSPFGETYAADNKVFARGLATLPDGRLTNVITTSAIVQP